MSISRSEGFGHHPVLQGDRHRLHHQRLGRAFFDTARAAGAGFAEDVMHLLGGADDGVGWANLAAAAAADAQLFGDRRRSSDRRRTSPRDRPKAPAWRQWQQPAICRRASSRSAPRCHRQSRVAAPEQPGKPHWPQLEPGIMEISSSTSGLPSTCRNLLATPRMMPSAAPSRVRLRMAAIIGLSPVRIRRHSRAGGSPAEVMDSRLRPAGSPLGVRGNDVVDG